MRRHWLRPLWIVLALLFLLEAWLWDHLEPPVAWFVRLIAWDKMRVRFAELIRDLPPWVALIVFLVPLVFVFPLKVLEVWLFVHQRWITAIVVLSLAKLLGVGIMAFIFEATRDKLMRIDWFRALYDWTMWLRAWAHIQVEPLKTRLRQYAWLLRPQRAARFLRRLIRLRRRPQGA